MRVAGMMRIRNESRWIERCVRSLLPVCHHVYILDDHSTDETAAICRNIERVSVFDSPFDGLDETRDKNHLLDVIPNEYDWIVHIDGDEALMLQDAMKLGDAMRSGDLRPLSLRVLYLWNDDATVRTDGVYGRFSRASVFPRHGSGRFVSRNAHGGFHCGNVPQGFPAARMTDIRLLHFGYRDRADRVRKYDWYNTVDPDNVLEDRYRHIAQGDLSEIPETAHLRHAGPLRLKPLSLA